MARGRERSQRRSSLGTLAALGAAACASWALLSSGAAFVFGVPPGRPASGGRGSGAAWARPAGGATARAAGGAGASSAKANLLRLLSVRTISQDVLRPDGQETKGEIDEAIVTLERLNGCAEPVYSELLDGKWVVKYSGAYPPGLLNTPTREVALFLFGGGFSMFNALSSLAGGFWGRLLGLRLGSKVISIEGGRDMSAAVEVEVAGAKQKMTYTAELMPVSGQRMTEEVVSVELPNPLGTHDFPLDMRRNILVTYLDDAVMVIRDESGVPDVLVRHTGSLDDDDDDEDTVDTVVMSEGQGEDPMESGAA